MRVEINVSTEHKGPDGIGGYPFDPGPLSRVTGFSPSVGDELTAWRPYSNHDEVVEATLTDPKGVVWVWFKNDNRWFPDGRAYPQSAWSWLDRGESP